MEAPELEKWLGHHIAAYPSIRDFIAREEGTKAIWFQVMQDCRLKDAIRITIQMSKGLLEAPRGFGDHPRFARKHCKLMEAAEPRSERRNGPCCGLCGGSGGVQVWAKRAHTQMRDGSFWKTKTVTFNGSTREVRTNGHYAETCACKCDLGTDVSRATQTGSYRWKGAAVFDDKCFVLCKHTNDAESIQALQDYEGVADTVEAGGGVKGREFVF